jgi:hypothetical protein
MAFAKATIDVSQRVNGEFKKVGDMTIHCPLLADILPFVTSAVKKDEKGNDVIEEGIPVYESQEANWVQGAILAAVKAQARNKLVPKTATVKEGLKIPENWAELTAEGTRGQGEGLAIAREAKAAFEEWLGKQGISEAAQNTLKTLFSNRSALMLQPAEIRGKVKARVEAFAGSIEDTNFLERIQRPVQAVLDACEGTDLGDL